MFIIDGGLKIFQWNGLHADPQEKLRAARYVHALVDQREGLPVLHVHEGNEDAPEMWALLGGKPASIPEVR